MTLKAQTSAFREFNRFHTRLVGALNEHLLGSGFTLPQARVLFEVGHAPPDAAPSARELGELLRVDTGYLSRLVAGLESDGLIERTPSPHNAKRLQLTLTSHGRKVFATLNNASANEIAGLLKPLPERDRRELVGAMARIRGLLGDMTPDRSFTLRDPEPGDMGWIVHRQARLYAEEYGWDWTFEGLVADIAGQFVRQFQPDSERCWVAEHQGQVVGAVFVVREDEQTAKLRMLYVEPSARGLGLGRRLVDEGLQFATARGYRRMVLWTNDVLVAARHIYQTAGFELVEEAPHHSFGKDLVGQVWARDL